MPARRSICCYHPSTDPSGTGAHLVDVATRGTGSEDGVTGTPVRPADPRALEVARAGLPADPELRRRRGAAGRRRYRAGSTGGRTARDTTAVHEAAWRGARR